MANSEIAVSAEGCESKHTGIPVNRGTDEEYFTHQVSEYPRFQYHRHNQERQPNQET